MSLATVNAAVVRRWAGGGERWTYNSERDHCDGRQHVGCVTIMNIHNQIGSLYNFLNRL